jgi:hypothetical protein
MPETSGRKKLTREQKEQIVSLHDSGERILAIADYLDLPPSAVSGYLEYRRRREQKTRVDTLSGAAFLIGLGVLFVPGSPFHFWPGILLVIGASSLVKALYAEERGEALQGVVWMAGLFAFFTFGFSLGALFLIIGLSMLMGFVFRPRMTRPAAARGSSEQEDWYDDDSELAKRKNEELVRESRQEEKAKRAGVGMRLSDDGELLDFVDLDEEARAARDHR